MKPDESIPLMTQIFEPQQCEVIKLEHIDGESQISQFEFVDSTGEEFKEVITNKSQYEELCTSSKAKYVPLYKRTKTLADLKKGHSTKNLEQAALSFTDKSDRAQIRKRLKNKD